MAFKAKKDNTSSADSAEGVVITEDINIDENANLDDILSAIDDTVSELSESEAALTVEPVSSDEMNMNKRVVLTSLFFGKLVYVSSATKARFVWKEYGSTQSMTMADIQIMHNEKPEYFEHPYLYTKDKDLIAYFNLASVYKNIHMVSQLETLLSKGNLPLIRQRLADLAKVGLRDSAIAQVRRLRNDKVLVNKDVMDVIREELKLDLD